MHVLGTKALFPVNLRILCVFLDRNLRGHRAHPGGSLKSRPLIGMFSTGGRSVSRLVPFKGWASSTVAPLCNSAKGPDAPISPISGGHIKYYFYYLNKTTIN